MNRSICKRCHRIRAVNYTRYCASCETELRALERRRPTRKEPSGGVMPDAQPVEGEVESSDG
jgi:hypothetical protein